MFGKDEKLGVVTFAQQVIVQGTRGHRRLLSDQTFVQAAFCPMSKSEKSKAVHTIVFILFYNTLMWYFFLNEKNNLNKLFTDKSFFAQNSPLTTTQWDNNPIDNYLFVRL